ncbi:amidohydrolase family protein [Streptomyces sp. NBC_00286]|nr:hypothetical protein [Streptomyces sp. NBC_00286]
MGRASPYTRCRIDAEGTITYAGPAASAPEDVTPTRTVDAGGRTVLPGFFDCHVHLAYAQGSPPGRRAELDPVLVTLDTATRMRQTLDAGITTARDVGGLSVGYRTAVETGPSSRSTRAPA